MDPWTVGLAALVVIGLAVVVYGALADRAKNRRAAQEMLSPPSRDIPRFSPDAPAPQYLSELQARRPPETGGSLALSAEQREDLKRRLDQPDVTMITAGHASKDFVTDPTMGVAVADSPAVLVCAEPVESIRELISLMEKLLVSGQPLVVVAPGLSTEVQSTLEVNHIRRTMRILAVVTTGADLATVARATHGEVVPRADLQSGHLGSTALGGCARWVSSAHRSYVIPADVSSRQP